MRRPFLTGFAKLLQLQTRLDGLLIFGGVVVEFTALRTLELNEVVLGHTDRKYGADGRD
jgi:hypothetical protein